MKGNRWLFQQDGAPAHTAKAKQEWLTETFQKLLAKMNGDEEQLN